MEMCQHLFCAWPQNYSKLQWQWKIFHDILGHCLELQSRGCIDKIFMILSVPQTCQFHRQFLYVVPSMQFFFRPLIGPLITWSAPGPPTIIFYSFLVRRCMRIYLVSILLSAAVEWVGVSRILDSFYVRAKFSFSLFLTSLHLALGSSHHPPVLATICSHTASCY